MHALGLVGSACFAANYLLYDLGRAAKRLASLSTSSLTFVFAMNSLGERQFEPKHEAAPQKTTTLSREARKFSESAVLRSKNNDGRWRVVWHTEAL